MLNLCVSVSISLEVVFFSSMTYPDSVSLVRPPKTTIPKTLAALPSNQYATVLSVTLGKLDPEACELVPLAATALEEHLVKAFLALSLMVLILLCVRGKGMEGVRRVRVALVV
jgi:hypothetical protein